ncbi:MAG: c-type cytochrome [Chloroflexota bacterium]
MRRVLKWIGIVLGSLVALLLLVLVWVYSKARLEFTKTYDVQSPALVVPTDAASLERGRHLAVILCAECHGDDLGGNPDFLNDATIGRIVTPNLTSGQGGLLGELSDADLLRILVQGVKPDGTSVFLMPSDDFRRMSDQDLGAVIAHLRSLPAVDRETPEPHVRLAVVGNLMYGAGAFGNMLKAGTIAGTARPTEWPTPGATAEYGAYLVTINSCRGCHGARLTGGITGEPGAPPAPNLTPGGELRAWSEAQFIDTLRTGVTPSGTKMESMPWEYKGRMTDDELKAVWSYLISLPALPTNAGPIEP